MDDDEWAAWTAANRSLRWDHSPTPCSDCVTGFALAMRAIGRCDGVPWGVEDDVLPLATQSRRVVSDQRATRALALLATGLKVAAVAEAMGIHEETVRTYVRVARAA
jgi:hypothetical protein